LLHKAWEARGKPLDKGWQVTREELINLRFPNENTSSKRLIIDFDPKANWRIGLVEPTIVFAYSFSDATQKVLWTPLMIKLRDVFYCEYEVPMTPEKKEEILTAGVLPCTDEKESVEFLYLNGERKGWNWGKNGMTNAAFIQGGAREYFRAFF
jgi:hypothetical protein